MRILPFLSLLLLTLLSPVTGHTAELPAGKNTSITLLADKDAAVAGQILYVMAHVDIRDGWHVYWVNPGDSGEAIKLNWTLPQGVETGDVQWPTPKRLPYDPLVNFGYEHEVGFILPVNVPVDYKETNLSLKARAEILVCEEICIPEYADLELTLPVAATNNDANQDIFTKVRNSQPGGTDLFGTYYETKDGQLVLDFPGHYTVKPESVYPFEWGVIDNAAVQKIEDINGGAHITLTRGTRSLDGFDKLEFVLRDANGIGLHTAALKKEAPFASAAASPSMPATASTNWPLAVLFAFIGGLILNLMPCVFPILSMKALSLVKLSQAERSHAQNIALAYTGGILTCFLGFGAVLMVLRGAGHSIGWGFQLQSPELVTALSWLMAFVAFNLLGFFDIRGLGGVGEKLTKAKGLTGSFFTGVLAALVATPCTAPFMATALGVALVQPVLIALLIFMALGLGLAFPFLLISFVPALARALPKPGLWMERFRQFLAFPMLAASLWLVWVAVSQTGENGMLYIVGGIILIGFMIWVMRVKSLFAKITLGLSAILLCAFLVLLPPREMPENIDAHVFSQEKIDAAIAQGQPVFVNMTAKWCVTCMVNDKVAISIPSTQALFDDKKVLYLKGDWTFQDENITKFLSKYGRSGVPLYVLYQNGKETVLPQILTPDIVARAFEEK